MQYCTVLMERLNSCTYTEMNEINALNDKVQKVTKALEAIQTKVAAQEVEISHLSKGRIENNKRQLEIRNSIETSKSAIQQDRHDLQELCNQSKTLELEVECNETSLSHLSVLIAKAADDYVKFSEKHRRCLNSDIELLKGNNFWLARINDLIIERGRLQQLLMDARVSKKLFQESEERRLRQLLELEEIRLSFSRDYNSGAGYPNNISSHNILPVIDPTDSNRGAIPHRDQSTIDRSAIPHCDQSTIDRGANPYQDQSYVGRNAISHHQGNIDHSREPVKEHNVDHDSGNYYNYKLLNNSYESFYDYGDLDTNPIEASYDISSSEGPLSPYNCRTLQVSSRVVTTDECDGTIYQTTENHTHLVYGASVSEEHHRSSRDPEYRSEPQLTAFKFPAFVNQDIKHPQDRPWFHEYKRRRTTDTPALPGDTVYSLPPPKMDGRLLTPSGCIDLTSQPDGLKGRFHSGLSLLRGPVSSHSHPAIARHVYCDMQN